MDYKVDLGEKVVYFHINIRGYFLYYTIYKSYLKKLNLEVRFIWNCFMSFRTLRFLFYKDESSILKHLKLLK